MMNLKYMLALGLISSEVDQDRAEPARGEARREDAQEQGRAQDPGLRWVD
jgi:hypothetical protein